MQRKNDIESAILEFMPQVAYREQHSFPAVDDLSNDGTAKHAEEWQSMAKHGEAWRRMSIQRKGMHGLAFKAWRVPSLSS